MVIRVWPSQTVKIPVRSENSNRREGDGVSYLFEDGDFELGEVEGFGDYRKNNWRNVSFVRVFRPESADEVVSVFLVVGLADDEEFERVDVLGDVDGARWDGEFWVGRDYTADGDCDWFDFGVVDEAVGEEDKSEVGGGAVGADFCETLEAFVDVGVEETGEGGFGSFLSKVAKEGWFVAEEHGVVERFTGEFVGTTDGDEEVGSVGDWSVHESSGLVELSVVVRLELVEVEFVEGGRAVADGNGTEGFAYNPDAFKVVSDTEVFTVAFDEDVTGRDGVEDYTGVGDYSTVGVVEDSNNIESVGSDEVSAVAGETGAEFCVRERKRFGVSEFGCSGHGISR